MSLINLDFVKIQDQHLDDDQEEEALSLCDLPISKFIRSNEENDEKGDDNNGSKGGDHDFDFDFGSLIGSGNALQSEMCSADEVFSGGQMLPFRHSISSETGLTRTQNPILQSTSRSESLDRTGSCSRSSSTKSTSTRSNSIRSQYSSTSSTSTSSNTTSTSVKTFPILKIKGRNNFHSQPSPKPQVWATSARGYTNNYANQCPILKKSTMWEVLRLGLVRTPEIELQDLKQRHRSSTSLKTTPFIMPRNNSFGSTISNSSNNNSKISDLLMELNKKKKNGGFFKSCKCSVLAIEPIPTREIGTKTNYLGTKIRNGPKNSNYSTNYGSVMKEDKELAQKRVTLQVQEEQKLKKEHRRQEKKVMSHHYRTFEWLRDLSHANVLKS